MRLACVLVALLGCSRVERHPPVKEMPREPSPAQLAIQRLQGGAPATPAPSPTPTPTPAPAPTPGTPAPAPAATGDGTCPADRVTSLGVVPADRSDCTTGDDACRKDCEAGDASACFYRASQLQALPARVDEALGLFGRACELGIAIACTNYGATLWSRSEAGAACARRVFEKACSVKEPFACGMIGRMMMAAARDASQLAAARAYLQRTCDELSGPPCKMLASYLVSGKLGAVDRAEITALIQRACEGGDASACADLRRMQP